MPCASSFRLDTFTRSATKSKRTRGRALAILVGTTVAAICAATGAEASILVDNSPAALGTRPNQFNANDSRGSNFLVAFTLDKPGYIDGFSIFTLNTAPNNVTIKLRTDQNGIPASSNLLSFTEIATFDHTDTGSQSVYRATASFSPIDLAAGTYWIGMSQTAIQRGNDPELGWLAYQPTAATAQGQYNLRGDTLDNPVQGLPFQIDGGVSVSSVPLPASAPMFGAALLAFGIAGCGVKRSQSRTAALD